MILRNVRILFKKMGIFSSIGKKEISNSAFDELVKKVSLISGEIQAFRVELDAIKVSINSVNGRISRKLNPEVREEETQSNLQFPFRT
jgi:hypothetical protein